MRVAVCEDSRTYAHALTRVLERDGDIEVVGVFETAEELLAAVGRLRPDLVTMDVELPGMNGVTATEHLMSTSPLPILMLSSHTRAGTQRAAAALAAGALDAVHKGTVPLGHSDGAETDGLRRLVRRLARARLRKPGVRPPTEQAAQRWDPGRGVEVIGVVASTGGPQALAEVVGGLPASFEIPLLIVQHIPPGFTEGLVGWLDGLSLLAVRLAADGQALAAGAWVAPDEAHLVVRAGSRRLGLDREGPAGLHRPSGDRLLTSMAAEFREGVVAVILTGMGRDGAEGVGAILAAGGTVIAESPTTAVVNGMPQAAVDRGADVILPLGEIPAALAALPRRRVA